MPNIVPLRELPLDERRELRVQIEARAAAHADYQRRARQVIATSQLWIPQAGPQLLAFLSPADELFYGGAAGGGKTDLILGLALSLHQRSIIYRREYPQAQAIEDRLRALVGSEDYNGTKRSWRDPADNRHVVEIGGLQDAHALENYRGRPYDLRAYDEAPQFYRDWLTFLSTWTRSADGWRTRTVLTGNPPENVDGEWVIDMFAPWLDESHPQPAAPGELRFFMQWEGHEIEVPDAMPRATDEFDSTGKRLIIWPRSRTFIPAKVADNAYLAGTDYAQSLTNLPEELRKKHLEGKFVRVRKDQPSQVIPTAWIQAAMERWKLGRTDLDEPIDQVGVDVSRGGSDPTVIARRSGHRILSLEAHQGEGTSDGPKVAALALDGPTSEHTLFAVDILGPGSSPVDALKLAGDLDVYPVNGSAKPTRTREASKRLGLYNLRADMYWQLRETLDPEQDGGAQLELPPDVELLRELSAVTYEVTVRGIKVDKKEDIKKRLGRSTDRADAVCYALLQRRIQGPAGVQVVSPAWGTAGARPTPAHRPAGGWRR